MPNYKKKLEVIQTNLQSPNALTTNTINGKLADITTISAGLVAGDADLVPGKIKAGVTIFGVAGTYETVITGDAVLADVLSGNTFYSTDSTTELTGTMPNNSGDVACVSGAMSGPLSTILKVIPASGYTDGIDDTTFIDLTTVDADLVTGNIKAGVTIFGVDGKTEIIDTTDAVDPAAVGDVALGKVFFINGVKLIGTAV
jgi:hypothetical protein